MISRLTNYLKETRLELKHVNWPNRKNTVRFTILVIGISLAVAIFLGALDILFQFLLKRFVL